MNNTESMGGGPPVSPQQQARSPAGETDNPEMFVIKNLDTGLEMRIDDFDRLAHIAADPDPANQDGAQPGLAKKAGLMKGTKAFKHWTQAQAKKATATAKKAVSHVKEVAHELNVQQVLTKHKLPFEASPSGRGTAEGGDVPRPLFEVLRRSTGESSSALHVDDPSLASVSVPASSDLSATSQSSSSKQGGVVPSVGTAAAAAAGGLADAVNHGTAAAARASGQQRQPGLQAAARPDSIAAPGAAAAGAVPCVQQPSVPVLVRLVSHKVSRRQYEAVVLAQVLEGSAGVVWVVAVSRDGAFMATAGQDCVLRVWQLTASRTKQPRSNWVYSSSSSDSISGVDADPGTAQASQRPSQASADEGGSSSSSGGAKERALQQQEQQQQQQGCPPADSSSVPPTEQPDRQQSSSSEQLSCGGQQASSHDTLQGQQHLTQHLQQQEQPEQQQQHHSSHLQPQQQQLSQPSLPPPPQQQQQQQVPLHTEQPPVVEFGAYFSRMPVRQYVGHSEDILDVSWSSSGGFLLSASLDKTVRLWHLSQPDCLRTFEHSDFVTSVQFHPTDTQRFVSGSLDGKIRVWSIPDSTVIATAQLHQDMVTAVSFSLNGSRVMAGTMRGRVRFYDLADGKLEYVAQVDVRNQRGQHASGKKVTSIDAVPGQPQQFLITTNDSRLRLLEGYGQVLKYKGHKNSTTQARATLSPDGTQLACGSDDGCLYLWQRSPSSGASAGGSAAADTAANGRAGMQQQWGGGSGGGGADRARSVAAAAAAQYQHLMSKNASCQAFQAHEPGQPVTAVAFVPPAAAGLPKFSVLSSNGSAVSAAAGAGGSTAGGAQSSAAAAAAAAAEVASWDSRRCFVQQLLVSVGFNGSIRVHELLGTQQPRSRPVA